MTQHRVNESEAEPAGEHIHMPEPSILPLINAAALAGTIVSITLSPFLLVPAAVIWVITTIIWIRSTVRDVNELPLDHH
jgi:Flp pilus assembly protein TadB